MYLCNYLMEILVGLCVWVNLLDMDISLATMVICGGVEESLIDGVVGVACCLICAVRWVHRMTCRLLIRGVFVSSRFLVWGPTRL